MKDFCTDLRPHAADLLELIVRGAELFKNAIDRMTERPDVAERAMAALHDPDMIGAVSPFPKMVEALYSAERCKRIAGVVAKLRGDAVAAWGRDYDWSGCRTPLHPRMFPRVGGGSPVPVVDEKAAPDPKLAKPAPPAPSGFAGYVGEPAKPEPELVHRKRVTISIDLLVQQLRDRPHASLCGTAANGLEQLAQRIEQLERERAEVREPVEDDDFGKAEVEQAWKRFLEAEPHTTAAIDALRAFRDAESRRGARIRLAQLRPPAAPPAGGSR